MDEPAAEERASLIRQSIQHLESLKAAGVEWLPASKASPAAMATSVSGLPPTGPKPAAQLSPPTSQRFSTPHVQSQGISTMLPIAQTASAMGLNDRRQALEILAASIKNCPRCPELLATRRQTVFGVGMIDPELCFIGEAPGADEDAQGEPFVGAAGQLLNKIIVACGMKREEVYICNVLKCRPPGNRTPLPNEAANCREYLNQQIQLVRPRFICALGACAAQNLLGTTQSIGRLRGTIHQYQGIPVWCTYHPAYLLRSPEKKRDVWEDMKQLLAHMGKPVPAT